MYILIYYQITLKKKKKKQQHITSFLKIICIKL